MVFNRSILSKSLVALTMTGLVALAGHATEDKDCSVVTRCRGVVYKSKSPKPTPAKTKLVILDKLEHQTNLFLEPGAEVTIDAYAQQKKIKVKAPAGPPGTFYRYVVRDPYVGGADSGISKELKIDVSTQNKTISAAKEGLSFQTKMGGASARAAGLQEGKELAGTTYSVVTDEEKPVFTLQQQSATQFSAQTPIWSRSNKLDAPWTPSSATIRVDGTTWTFDPQQSYQPEDSYAYVISEKAPSANAAPTIVVTRAPKLLVDNLMSSLPEPSDVDSAIDRISSVARFGLYERAFNELAKAKSTYTSPGDVEVLKRVEEQLIVGREKARQLSQEKVGG